jgi:type VI secretion system secreted protein VgrG
LVAASIAQAERVAVAAGPLRVVRFAGQEGISGLFGFRLELAGPDLDIAALVDQPALLRIESLDAPRYVHGVLSEFEYVGRSRNYELYEADLVPWIWRCSTARTAASSRTRRRRRSSRPC